MEFSMVVALVTQLDNESLRKLVDYSFNYGNKFKEDSQTLKFS